MENEKRKQTQEFKSRIYHFVIKLIEFIDNLPRDNVSRRVGDQLLRSGTSVLGNYVEGQSASSKKELANFFAYSLKSSNESRLWLCILRDSKRVLPQSIEWFLNELEEFSKIFASSIMTIKRNRKQHIPLQK